MSEPTQPPDIPPYQLQALIASVNTPGGPFSLTQAGVPNEVRCAQALGTEIYVGCSNGELLRYALEETGPAGSKTHSYVLQSRQSLPQEKSVDDLVLLPSIARALVLSGSAVHFYTLPSLDPVPTNLIAPVRNVIQLAVDERHLARPFIGVNNPQPGGVDPVDFCTIKRATIALYTLRDRLFFMKDIPLPGGASIQAAKRSGQYICYADKENYNVVDLERGTSLPLLPISQAMDTTVVVKPLITIVGEAEFLILSWTGASTLGVFITGTGDPVRGTLEWPAYPESISLDYPYITALLPDQRVEVQNIDEQHVAQIVDAPSDAEVAAEATELPPGWPAEVGRKRMCATFHPFVVPSVETAQKMRMEKVKLVRAAA